MQTCSICNALSPDELSHCVNCQADLEQFSKTAIALQRFQANSRVTAVRLAVAEDACPACRQYDGTYPKDQAPVLPIPGCSHENGCRCFYEPLLSEIYP